MRGQPLLRPGGPLPEPQLIKAPRDLGQRHGAEVGEGELVGVLQDVEAVPLVERLVVCLV